MKVLTRTALFLSLFLGSAGLTVGCGDRTVSSTEKTKTSSDGSTEKKTEEVKVDRDTGAKKTETTVEKKDTTP